MEFEYRRQLQAAGHWGHGCACGNESVQGGNVASRTSWLEPPALPSWYFLSTKWCLWFAHATVP